jgi:hypothetical protein
MLKQGSGDGAGGDRQNLDSGTVAVSTALLLYLISGILSSIVMRWVIAKTGWNRQSDVGLAHCIESCVPTRINPEKSHGGRYFA